MRVKSGGVETRQRLSERHAQRSLWVTQPRLSLRLRPSRAGRVARSLAGPESPRWGVFVTTDAPLLKCLAEGATGLGADDRIAVTPAAWGATTALPAHGSYARKASLMAAVDWYLLGLVDQPLAVVGSGFSRVAQVRNLIARSKRGAGQAAAVGPGWVEGGAERWFWGGRAAVRGPVAGRDAAVNVSSLALLASLGAEGKEQCPETAYLALPKELLSGAAGAGGGGARRLLGAGPAAGGG